MSQMNQVKASRSSSFSGCILVSLITGLTWFNCLTATFLAQVFLFNIHVFLCALSCSLIPIKWAPRCSWAWEGQRTGGGYEQILGKTWKTEQLDYFFGRNPKNIKNALISRDLFCSLIAKQRPTQRRELANQRLTQTSITKAIGVRWLPEAYSIRVTVSVQWSKVWFVVQVTGTHWIICPTRIQWTCGKFDSVKWDVLSIFECIPRAIQPISTFEVLKTSYLKGRQPEAGWDALKGAANLSLRSQKSSWFIPRSAVYNWTDYYFWGTSGLFFLGSHCILLEGHANNSTIECEPCAPTTQSCFPSSTSRASTD